MVDDASRGRDRRGRRHGAKARRAPRAAAVARRRRAEPRAGRRRAATPWSSSMQTRSRQRAGRAGAAAGAGRVPGRGGRAARGTFTSAHALGLGRAPAVRDALPAARRARRAAARSPRSASPSRETCRCAGTRATAVRTGSSASTPSRRVCGSCFDPRFHGGRTTTGARPSPTSVASSGGFVYGFARGRGLLASRVYRRLSPRFPLHYFALLRLPVIYGRIRSDARLRSRFLRLLPWLVVGEWLLGVSALRYVFTRPDAARAGGRSFE